MKQLLIASTAFLLLAACGEEERTAAEGPGEEETQAEAAGEGEEPEALSEASAEPEEAPPVPEEGEGGVQIGPEFVGTWAANREWCDTGVTTGDEQPIEITETTFGGYENQCSFQDVQQDGRDWNATLACEGEGQQETREITLSADEEMLTVYYHDIGDQGVTYYRCPTP